MIKLILMFVAGLYLHSPFSIGTEVVSKTHFVAERLPSDIALLISIPRPLATTSNLFHLLDCDESFFVNALDLALNTDPRDGTQLTAEFVTQLGGIFNTESIHIVIANSEENIGDVALLIESGEWNKEVGNELLKGIVRNLVLLLESTTDRGSRYAKLLDSLALWESNISTSRYGNWTILATSSEFSQQLGEALSGAKVESCLADNRRYQECLLSFLSDPDMTIYVSPRNARQLAIATNLEHESHWDAMGRDEISWIGVSIALRSNQAQREFIYKTTFASTQPVQGDNQYWNCYRQIDTFPCFPDEFQVLAGKNLDYARYFSIAESQYPMVYGKERFDASISEPIMAWNSGYSRQQIGGQSFAFHGSRAGDSAALYMIEPNTEGKAVQKVVDQYFLELQNGITQGTGIIVNDFVKSSERGFPV